MKDTIRQYNALIFPCRGNGDKPSSQVHMEIAGDFRAFYEEAMEWISAFRVFNESGKTEGVRIHDGEGEDFVVSCSEEEIILSLLYCCKGHEAKVREICCRGDRYTDISDIRFLEGFANDMYTDYERAHTIRLHAKKNGCNTLIYIFGPCIRWDYEGFKIAFYPSSSGMVEVDEGKMYYAGTFCYNCYEEIVSYPDIPEFRSTEVHEYSDGVEVFLETDGENVTFSVLMNGELYKKISKDEKAVTFYSTIRDGVWLHTGHIVDDTSECYRLSFWECRDVQDVIFRKNEKDEYLYVDGNQEVRENWSGIPFVPPQTPEPGSLNQDSAHRLCQDYIDAFYAPEPAADYEDRKAAVDSEDRKNAADSEERKKWKEKKEIVDVIAMKKRIQEGLKTKVKGQDMAVEKFVDGYIRYQIRGKVPGKPAGVYLFAGPPGTGKTYLAETFSKLKDVADAGYQYKRFDMAAYGGESSDAVLGLVGFEKTWKSAQPGQLTEFVRKNPKCVLLFDEIEKASPQVRYLFLSVLEGAVLTDKYYDEQVSFEDAILIFTTNEGRDLYEDNRETNLTALPDSAVIDGLEAADFAPELRSRLQSGTIVMFNHLSYHNMLNLFRSAVGAAADQIVRNGFPFELTYDDKLPKLYLLSKGGRIDARFVTSNARMMAEDYFIQAVEYMNKSHRGKPEELEKISVSVEGNDEVRKYFERTDRPRILGYAGKCPKVYIGETVRLRKGLLPEEGLKELDWMADCQWAQSAEDIHNILKNCNWNSRRRDDRYDAVLIDLGKNFQWDSASEEYACLKAAAELKLDIPIIAVDRGDTEEKNPLMSLGTLDFVQGVAYQPRCPEEDSQESGRPEEESLALDRKELSAILDREHFVKTAEELFREGKRISGDSRYEYEKESGELKLTFTDLCVKEAMDEGAEARRQNRKYLLVDKPNVRLRDIFGNELVKKAVERCIDNIRNPEKYRKAGARLMTGILMYGAPGMGKTMFAKAMAYESGAAFISAVGADFLNGDGVIKMEEMFNTARRKRPCILFIDEFDAISKNRYGGIESNQEVVLEKFLKEMDGLETDNDGVYVVGATNYSLEDLDGAVTRRFSARIFIPFPNMEERQEFLFDLLEKKGLKGRISESSVRTLNIQMYEKMGSYAEIKTFIEESIAEAVHENKVVTEKYLLNRVHDETVGIARRTINPQSQMTTAFHEAGHAVLDYLFGRKIVNVTIVSRGNYGGYARASANLSTGKDFLEQICISFAGRAAEMIYLEPTKAGYRMGINVGAGSDLQAATQTAYNYVCRFGLSDRTMVVPYMFTSRTGEIPEAVLPESEKEAIWTSIKQVLDQQWKVTIQLLQERWDEVRALAYSLAYMQELSGETAEWIIGNRIPYVDESCFLNSDNDYRKVTVDGAEIMVPFGYPVYPYFRSAQFITQTEEDIEGVEGRKYYYAVKTKKEGKVYENLTEAFMVAYQNSASCRRFRSVQAAQVYLEMLELKVFRRNEERFCGIYVDALAEQLDVLGDGKGRRMILTRETVSLYRKEADEAGYPLAMYLMRNMEQLLDKEENKIFYLVVQIYDKALQDELLYYMDAMEIQAKQYRRNLGYKE